MLITISIRDVYGKSTISPVCDVAKTFAAIAGTTTLTPATMRHIESLGYRVVLEQPARDWRRA